MSNFKEIVTKAVVGKGKKTFSNDYSVEVKDNISTILGCWIINHVFNGKKVGDSVVVEGSFDTNIWYSKNDNTETEVTKDSVNYNETIPIKTLEDYDGQDEIIVRVIKQPTVTKAEIKDNKIEYTIEKVLAAELVGDTKIRVGVDLDTQDEDVNSSIDEGINEDFIK